MADDDEIYGAILSKVYSADLIEKNYDYGYGGELVSSYDVDSGAVADLVMDFVRPLQERAERAEATVETLEAQAGQLQALAEDLESRLAGLLCDLTDGRMSKTNYDVRTMVQAVEAAFERHYGAGESSG